MFALRALLRPAPPALRIALAASTKSSIAVPAAFRASLQLAPCPASECVRRLHSTPAASLHASPAPVAARTGLGGDGARFDSLALSAVTQRVLREGFQYELMSDVQAQCIPVALSGKDIVARAKTGTGKTLAFLIPLVEQVVKAKRAGASAPGGVRALIISPTRELAAQIEEEAKRLCGAHGLRVGVMVGGTSVARDQAALGAGIDVLVGTPGRLQDVFLNVPGAKAKLKGLTQLVLDEADRLLDMGFKQHLDAILGLLPPPSLRQTQLYSATFPSDVAAIAARALKPGYATVNTVGKEVATHLHVAQQSLVVPQAQVMHALHTLLQAHMAANPHAYKVIVFFTTGRLTGFASRLFTKAGIPALELHAKLSQSKRTSTSDAFRASTRGILFSSDVSARGLDFPGVSLVLQVGLTDAESYVHRLGRTARAGKEGHGMLLLSKEEAQSGLLETLQRGGKIDPLRPESGTLLASLVAGQPAPKLHPLSCALASVEQDENLRNSAAQAYRAMLGFYNGQLSKLRWSKDRLVSECNTWSTHAGLSRVPSVEPRAVGMMGLKGVPGLRIEAAERAPGGGGRGGRGGGSAFKGAGKGAGAGARAKY